MEHQPGQWEGHRFTQTQLYSRGTAVKEDILGQGTVGQDSIEMELFGPLPAVEKRIEGPAPGPDNDWGSLTEPIHSLRPVAELVSKNQGI